MDPAVDISEHFTWIEARCHDGSNVPDALKPNTIVLASQLELLRSAWGGPLFITSWYRTPTYNAALRQAAIDAGRTPGTAKDSQHMTASAADIRPVHLADIPILRKLIENMLSNNALPRIGGWGVYPQWIHLDVRPRPDTGHIAFWLGEGVASEMA